MSQARPPHTFKVHGPSLPPARTGVEARVYEITSANGRLLDRLATTEFAIPSIVLMENAAIGLCAHALEMLGDGAGTETGAGAGVVVLCGPGNNGGDGLALARHLHNHALAVRVVLSTDPDHYTGDAKANLDIITRMGLDTIGAGAFLAAPPSSPPALIVDALLGTGLARPVEGVLAELIAWANTTRAQRPGLTRTLAADIPSGLDADTGRAPGDSGDSGESGGNGDSLRAPVVIADRTVTFAALKLAMSRVEAQPYLGETYIAPIGVPIALLDRLATRIIRPTDPTRA